MAALVVKVLALCSLSMLVFDVSGVSGSAADDSFRDELLARIKSLEEQGLDQIERLVRQETTIHEYKQRVAVLERTVAELQHRHGSDLSKDSSEPQDPTVGQGSDLKAQQRSISTLGQEATRGKRMLLEGHVAFHSVMKSASAKHHIKIGETIVFPDVMLNIRPTGGGYNSLQGVFTAPRPGIYLFSVSVLSYTNAHATLSVNLMKNGIVLARAYGHGVPSYLDQGSVTRVMQLAVGDKVWVSLQGAADTSMWGDYFDSFTGCLIIPY